jgi:GTP cyclohydrolase I
MKHNEEIHDEIGDNHISSCATNPLREDALILLMTKNRKYKKDVENILLTLGMDLTDDSIKGTPNRVAKMFVKEILGIES